MSVDLSLEPCYAGLQRVELLPSDEGYFWFQFVEGCGYDVRKMTPAEARAVAAELNEMADQLDPAWAEQIPDVLTKDPIAELAKTLARRGVTREQLAEVMHEDGLDNHPAGVRLINLHRNYT